MNNFSARLLSLRKKLSLTQTEMAERMGLSMSYISQLETDKRTPSDAVETLVRMMEERGESEMLDVGNRLKEDETPYRVTRPFQERRIPIIGWAHAGEAGSYEEMPEAWKGKIPTECRDPKAFAVILEGDSMEPKFSEGDILVVQPTEQAHSGSLVVAKFENDGVIFRRFEITGKIVTLVPLNPRYEPSQHSVEEFSWIYPVWGRWTQVWR